MSNGEEVVVNNSWMSERNVIGGVLVAEGLWLAGLTYYVVTVDNRLTASDKALEERIKKLETQCEAQRKKNAEFRVKINAQKNIETTLKKQERHIEEINDKLDMFSETLENFDASQDFTTKNKQSDHRKGNKITKMLTGKHSDKKKEKKKEKSSSSESASEEDPSSLSEEDISNMYDELECIGKNKKR